MKKCSKCKTEKQLSEFYNSKSGEQGKHHYCKACHSILAKNTYNHEKSSKKQVFKKYGLTLEDVEKMFLLQDKKCKICQVQYEKTLTHGGLYVDHCHVSGKVRGLLCRDCNMMLGLCKDKTEILHNAIVYLNKHN
jgi:hypothetical protein